MLITWQELQTMYTESERDQHDKKYKKPSSRGWPFRVTWRHRSRDRFPGPFWHFLLVVLWNR